MSGTPDLPPIRKEQTDAMMLPFAVETSGLTWLAVHGMLCLGLRHPGYKGPSRALVLNFVQALGQEFIERGILTAAELKLVERVEQQESPHGGIR